MLQERSGNYLDQIDLRQAADEDRPAVLALLSAALERDDDPRFSRLQAWKHQRNTFGASMEWVAVTEGRVVGYRAFLRWEFTDGDRVFRAVRAVDTATDPAQQGKGIFQQLTMRGLEAARADGVDFVFNTPNDKSRPGYLKMGWQLVGVLTPRLRPRSIATLPTVVRSRAPAGHWAEPSEVGMPSDEAFADDDITEQLLASSVAGGDTLTTRRSAEFLRWRYDGDLLGYRVVTLGRDISDGAACFRLRRRGRAREATICDLLVPEQDPRARRRLIRTVVRSTRADYALLLGGARSDSTIPVVGQGPTLTWRSVCEPSCPAVDRWSLTMGDIELF